MNIPFLVIVLGIAVLSFLLSLFSLWNLRKIKEISQARKSLKKERVVFHRGHSSL